MARELECKKTTENCLLLSIFRYPFTRIRKCRKMYLHLETAAIFYVIFVS